MQDKFSREENGYSKKEVNNFIADVIDKTENIINKCHEQQDEINRLRNELEKYKKINTSVEAADKYFDNKKEYAEVDAINIVESAKNNANRIVNDALIRANEIDIKREVLEKNIRLLKRKLKIMLEDEKSIIEEIEKLELSED